jgi:hypothetical protein
MYQTIEAVWKDGNIVPLEPIVAEENTPLMVTVLRVKKTEQSFADKSREAKIRATIGSMRRWTSGVDAFIAQKQEEIDLEECH